MSSDYYGSIAGELADEGAAAARLDSDPAVLAWARGKVLEVTGGWRQLAARMAADDMDANAEKWRRVAQIVENAFIGGKTGDLGAFDERKADG